MKRLAALAIVAALAACATPNVSRDYRLDPSSAQGVVLGSITYKGRFSGYRVHYRALKGDLTGYFESGQAHMVLPYIPERDFEDEEFKGDLFVAELPPGQYEIYAWEIGSGAATVHSNELFSINFEITPGSAVYAGNFEFIQTRSLGLTVTGAQVAWREMAARDLSKLAEKYPGMAQLPVGASMRPGEVQPKLGGGFTTTLTFIR